MSPRAVRALGEAGYAGVQLGVLGSEVVENAGLELGVVADEAGHELSDDLGREPSGVLRIGRRYVVPVASLLRLLEAG